MIILRNKEFSNKKSKKKNSSDKIVGAALVGGGVVGNTAAAISAMKEDKSLRNEQKEISKKLIKEAENQGTKVFQISKEKSHYANKKLVDSLKKGGHKLSVGKAGDYIAADTKRADLLSHELGHSKHYQGRSGSVVGKGAHRLYGLSKHGTATPHGLAASFANGYISGKKAEKDGEKESKWNKARTAVVSAGVATPMLISEAAASRQGIKALKKAGASKKLIKESKKRLGSAFGTYASTAGINTGVGYLGRASGRKSVREEKEFE